MKKVYLACPYSHSSKAVRNARVMMADMKAAELMEEGYRVFSPLSHSHDISEYCYKTDPQDHKFWINQDLWILEVCDELHVVCLKGWTGSFGVTKEIKEAKRLGLEVVYHHYIRGKRIGDII